MYFQLLLHPGGVPSVVPHFAHEPETCRANRGEKRQLGSPDMRSWVQLATSTDSSSSLFFSDSHSSLAVVGNVQLHNRDELLEALHPQPELDVGIVLAAYKKWGRGCFAHFRGRFSFIILDTSDRSFWGAVDHLGLGAIYYSVDSKGTVCLSNHLKYIPDSFCKTLNFDYIGRYLLNCYPDDSSTVWQGVSSVPSGNVLRFERGDLTIRKYWHPAVSSGTEPWKKGVPPSEVLRTALVQSVECSLRRNSNGLLLSGGLDSSAIACIGQKALVDRGGLLKAYSRVPDLNKTDCASEQQYVEIIRDQCNIPVRFLHELTENKTEQLHDYYASRGSFPFHPFPFLTRPLVEAAAGDGCSVLLSGFGGDETASVSGIGSLGIALRHGPLREAWAVIDQFRATNELSWWKVLRYHTAGPMVSPHIRLLLRSSARGEDKSLQNRFVQEKFVSQLRLRRLVCKGLGYRGRLFADPAKELQIRLDNQYFRPFFELGQYYQEKLGVQYAFPFLDKTVVELMLSVSPVEYLKGGQTRSIFRRAMKGILPEKVRLRQDKVPITTGMPFSKILLRSRLYIESILDHQNSIVWEFVDRKRIEQTWRQSLADEEAKMDNWMALEIGRCLNVAAFLQWTKL